ncbi:hypothetical protein RDV64_22335 [Acuticoccus sp. MNP-M23]|uniref:hypothetical protein n=1 Tax=Acuticoccus sp. MNP-M23 TaxID=3072793 RepID=UPI0028162C8A|nr:hypothetical protein [Acuticoccus sp. MNP-M23]WMS42759.1 hypothetical protein RDV64_22335 [Acuticoccus sp. MNP-M23]
MPKHISHKMCAHPEDLNGRCVVDSRLGVLSRGSGSTGVDIVFSCRKKTGVDEVQVVSGVADQDKLTFQDIAVIQHDRATGNTCFYQYFASGPVPEIPMDHKIPAAMQPEGMEFWGKFSGYDICTGCHTNNAFVRSPHYNFALQDFYGIAAG